jgi:hypothetical protein
MGLLEDWWAGTPPNPNRQQQQQGGGNNPYANFGPGDAEILQLIVQAGVHPDDTARASAWLRSTSESLGRPPSEIMQLVNVAGGIADEHGYFVQPNLTSGLVGDVLFPQAPGGGGAGRTQFASERALDMAQVESLRRTADENERQGRFGRAADKLQLLQASERETALRRESAMSAFEAALPYAVTPGTTHLPGMEPGGPASVWGAMLGAPIPPDAGRMPTFDIGTPLNAMAAPPVQGGPQQIESVLAGLL